MADLYFSRPQHDTTITMFIQQEDPKDRLYRKVFRLAPNRWMLDDKYALRCIQILFDALPNPSLKHLSALDIFFIRSDGILASTVAPRKKSHLVIIYPELFKMMRSAAPLRASAVLAHELGHIILRHSARKIGPTTAQIEADRFVAEIGLGRELRQVLLGYEGCPDYPERMGALAELLGSPPA